MAALIFGVFSRNAVGGQVGAVARDLADARDELRIETMRGDRRQRAAVVGGDPDDQAGGVQHRADARERALQRAGIGKRRQVGADLGRLYEAPRAFPVLPARTGVAATTRLPDWSIERVRRRPESAS